MKNTLVVFYSLEGHTAHIAQLIKEKLNCDILEIKPKKEIKSKGFMRYFWGGRQVKMNQEPELEPIDTDFKKYDTILLGSPIWAWSVAPPIRTLLKGEYLKGKNIYLFYSFDGSNGKAEDRINKLAEGTNLLGIRGILKNKNQEVVDADVTKWVDSLNL